MQVNTRASHAARVERMGDLQRQLDTLQGRIATGKRLAVPSDDPVASGIATRLKRVEASGAEQLRALDGAASRLAATDVALGSAASVMQRAQEIAILGANATLSRNRWSSRRREPRSPPPTSRRSARCSTGCGRDEGAGPPPALRATSP